MALTPEEQQELQSIDAELSQIQAAKVQQPQQSAQNALSLQEQQELAAIDAELEQIQSARQAQYNEPPVSQPSANDASWLQRAGQTVDVLGGPTRAGIMAAVQGKNPIAAASEQFMSPYSKIAPTGKEISQEVGVSSRQIPLPIPSNVPGLFDPAAGGLDIPEEELASVSPAGAVGLGVDIVADPLFFIAPTKIIKGAVKYGSKAGKAASKAIWRGSAAAADLALGTKKITQTGEVIGKSIDDAKNLINSTFRPKVAPDFTELTEIARKNNIDEKFLPESFEFGKDSFIDRASRQRRELGGQGMENFKEGLNQTTRALDDKVAKIGGGEVLDAASAGREMRAGFQKGINDILESSTVTYGRMAAENPGLVVPKKVLQGIEPQLKEIGRVATDIVEDNLDPILVAPAKRILRVLETVGETKGDITRFVRIMKGIGEIAYKTKGVQASIPADVKALRKIYSQLSDAVTETARLRIGDEAADALILNNGVLSSMMSDKHLLKDLLNPNIADEVIAKRFLYNADTKKIEALRSLVPAETMQRLKGSYLGDASNGILRKNQDNITMFRSTYNKMRQKLPTVNALFDESEIKEVSELLDFGDRFGSPVMSTSGTGASNVISKIVENIASITTNDLLIDNLKQAARGRNARHLERLAEATSKEEAVKIIKRLKLPKRLSNAAIRQTKKIDYGVRKAIIKSAAIQSREQENER